MRIALFLQALNPAPEPPHSFQAITRLVSPENGNILEETVLVLPNSPESVKWYANEVILEKISIPIPPDIPIGAYQVNISFRDNSDAGFWPISKDNDINPLDRVQLGMVSVPWQGNISDFEHKTAAFSDRINLIGYKVSDFQVGQPILVNLLWQAMKTLEENYVVFVHVLDESGQLVASHDGVPLNGRYPTTAWHENDIIPDEHIIELPPNLPHGNYAIKIGIYLPESGERLNIVDDGGQPVQNDALLVEQFSTP
jgi:hypothetical protein